MVVSDVNLALSSFMNVIFDREYFKNLPDEELEGVRSYELMCEIKNDLFQDPEDFLCKLLVHRVVAWVFDDFPFVNEDHPSFSNESCVIKWVHRPYVIKNDTDCSIYAHLSVVKCK